MCFEKDQIKTNDYLINYRVAVGLLVGQGCDRSELPCLADGITKQGRRSWSFYIYRSCCPVNRRICGQMLLTNDIVFGRWFPQNRQLERKKTKTYGLEGLYAPLRQGRSFHSQPCPTNRPTATRQQVRQPFVFQLIVFKGHLIPCRIHIKVGVSSR